MYIIWIPMYRQYTIYNMHDNIIQHVWVVLETHAINLVNVISRNQIKRYHKYILGGKKDKFIIQWKKLQISSHSTKRYFAFHTQMIFLKTEIDLHININTLWDICRRQESTGVKPGTRVTCAEKQISGLILENSPFFSYSLRPFFRTVSHTKWFNSSYFEFSQVYTECYSKGPIMQFTIQ